MSAWGRIPGQKSSAIFPNRSLLKSDPSLHPSEGAAPRYDIWIDLSTAYQRQPVFVGVSLRRLHQSILGCWCVFDDPQAGLCRRRRQSLRTPFGNRSRRWRAHDIKTTRFERGPVSMQGPRKGSGLELYFAIIPYSGAIIFIKQYETLIVFGALFNQQSWDCMSIICHSQQAINRDACH